jgi:hypothetical protein
MQTQPNYTAPQSATLATDGVDPETHMIESDFIVEFRKKFIDEDGAPLWEPDVSMPMAVSNDIAAVLRKLYLLAEGKPQASSGDPGSAELMVSELITELGWPASPPVPTDWQTTPGAIRFFRRYEIACAVNILLQTRSLVDGGNNPPGWPPKKK